MSPSPWNVLFKQRWTASINHWPCSCRMACRNHMSMTYMTFSVYKTGSIVNAYVILHLWLGVLIWIWAVRFIPIQTGSVRDRKRTRGIYTRCPNLSNSRRTIDALGVISSGLCTRVSSVSWESVAFSFRSAFLLLSFSWLPTLQLLLCNGLGRAYNASLKMFCMINELWVVTEMTWKQDETDNEIT